MIVDYGEWLPDVPDFNNPGVIDAKNVIPAPRGYQELNSLSTYSSALTARCQGLIVCKDKSGNVYNFAGDASKLYRMGGVTYSDVSGSTYTCDPVEFWEFCKYDTQVIATQFGNYPQVFTMGSATAFEDLTTTLRARHVDVVRSFVVFGNIYDEDGTAPNRIRWSALNDPTDYTESTATQSGSQDLAGAGGWIQKVVGGEYGTIFQEWAIWRMTYIGGEAIFQFDEVERGRGTPAPQSVVKVGNVIYYLGQDGFYAFDGVTSHPIGKNKVDSTFFTDVDKTYYYRVNGVADWEKGLVMWAYASNDATAGTPDKVLIYDTINQKWSYAVFDSEILGQKYDSGYTLEDLDAFGTMDTITPTLDSRAWMGGNDLALIGFNTSHRMCTFTGAALTAVIETKEFEGFSGFRTIIKQVRPLSTGGSTSIKIGYRNEQTASRSYTSNLTAALSGRYTPRVNARYLTVQHTITGGLTEAIGVDIEAAKGGRR